MKFRKNAQYGFTLVELLIVISIIGILTAVTVVNYGSAQQKARDAQRKNDFKILRDQLEQYKLDQKTQSYPIANAATTISVANYTTMQTLMTTGGYLKPPYPKDPKDKGAGIFMYRYQSDGSTYTLDTCLENKSDPSKQATVSTQCTTANPNYQVTNP
ncbi:MAG: type II secretion system GspH family protein [bacterium]|nr:type II secretion system GspH family protein [bacterium]